MLIKAVEHTKDKNKLVEWAGKHPLLVIFIVCMVVYNMNLRPIPSLDSLPAALLPFNFLDSGTVYMDNFAENYLISHVYADGKVPYSMKLIDGHYISIFPMVIPVIVTPLYIIPYILVRLTGTPLSLNDMIFANFVVPGMEKLIGSGVTALSVVVLFMVLRRLFSEKNALLCTFVYAFATLTWTISSQALWQHGFIELFLCVMVYIMLADKRSYNNKNVAVLGVLAGLMIMCRPPDMFLALPVIYYMLRSRKADKIVTFAVVAFLVAAPFLAYNQHFYGHLTGYYSHWEDEYAEALLTPGLSWLEAFVGLLVSPSRGLLTYSPVLILSFIGMFMSYRSPAKESSAGTIDGQTWKGMALVMVLSAILTIFAYMLFPRWFGGWNYGYRYLTGMLPIMIIFLGYFFERFKASGFGLRRAVTALIVALLVWSVFVQVVGAFYYPNGNWDGAPVSVDKDPGRVWDVADNQVIRSFSYGPIWPPYFVRAIEEAL